MQTSVSAARGMLSTAAIAATATLLGSSPTSFGQTITNGTVTAKLTSVGSINIATRGEPLDMSQPAGDPSRIYVATHGGHIRLIKNGALTSGEYLDVRTFLSGQGITLQGGSGSDERGLIGMAFHPDFNVSGSPGFGKFFTYTSESVQGTADFSHPELGGTGGAINYQNVLRQWNLTTPGNDTAGALTSTILFSVNKNQTNHNGGGLKFGPNNYLYLSLGDGGGGNDFNGGSGTMTTNDGHTNLTGNGQDISDIYGKIVRIDPLATGTPNTGSISANGKYGRPASNPFTAGGNPGLDEIFLYGMRNPFRFSFDKANPNKLYVGDVGQGSREEVDLTDVSTITSSNNNFGWPFREGTLHNSNYASQPDVGNNPIGEYTHGDGISISGGFVYRGSAIPELAGKYVFGDLGGASGNTGRLFYMDATGGTIRSLLIDPTGTLISGRLYSFGEDQTGELYTMWGNGNILKLVPEPSLAGLGGALLMGFLTRRRLRRCS